MRALPSTTCARSTGRPKGLGTFILVLGWIIGGFLGMALLSRVLMTKTQRLGETPTLAGWASVYALASAGLGVVLMNPLMGTLTGSPWALLGAGTLIVFVAAMTTAALISLFGMAGIMVAIVAFVVLGNPTSGGAVPIQMLSGGYPFLANVLPNNAAISLVHGIEYFGGNGIGHPLFVLGLYAAVALVVCFAQAYRQTRVRANDGSTTPNLVSAQ